MRTQFLTGTVRFIAVSLCCCLILTSCETTPSTPNGGGSDTDRHTVRRPVIGMDDAGNAAVAWLTTRSDGFWGDLCTWHYQAGTGWLEPKSSADESRTWHDGTAREHQIAMPGSFYSCIVYTAEHLNNQGGLFGSYVYIRRCTNPAASQYIGSHVEDPTLLEDTIDQEAAQVAINDAGNACVVWRKLSRIRLQQYEEAANYESAIYDNPVPGLGLGYVYRVCIDSAGNAIVIWIDGEGAASVLRSSRTPWESDEIISTGSNIANPQIVMGGDDSAIAVWIKDGHVRSRQFNGGLGTWGSVVEIENGVETSQRPMLAINDTEDAIVVWEQMGRIFASLMWILQPVPVSAADVTGFATNAGVAIDNGQNAIVVWERDGGIYAARFTFGEGWSDEAEIGRGTEPALAGNGSGDAIAVWISSNGRSVEHHIFGAQASGITLIVHAWLDEEPLAGASVRVDLTTSWETVCSGVTNGAGDYECDGELSIGDNLFIEVHHESGLDQYHGMQFATVEDGDGDGRMEVTVTLEPMTR